MYKLRLLHSRIPNLKINKLEKKILKNVNKFFYLILGNRLFYLYSIVFPRSKRFFIKIKYYTKVSIFLFLNTNTFDTGFWPRVSKSDTDTTDNGCPTRT